MTEPRYRVCHNPAMTVWWVEDGAGVVMGEPALNRWHTARRQMERFAQMLEESRVPHDRQAVRGVPAGRAEDDRAGHPEHGGGA